MAVKWSTALRNYLLGVGSFRECFADAIVKLYSGTVPTSPDDAEGTLVCPVSLASGTVGADETSIAKQCYLAVTKMDAGSTITPTFNGASMGAFTAGTGGDLATRLAEVAARIEEAALGLLKVIAVADTSAGTGLVFRSGIPGLTFTLTIAASGAGTTGNACTQSGLVDGSVIANTRKDGVQFGTPVLGVISKESGVWSGENIVDGTITHFRVVRSDDTGVGGATGLLQPRLQGVVARSGAEMNGYNILEDDAITTLKTFAITFPES